MILVELMLYGSIRVYCRENYTKLQNLKLLKGFRALYMGYSLASMPRQVTCCILYATLLAGCAWLPGQQLVDNAPQIEAARLAEKEAAAEVERVRREHKQRKQQQRVDALLAAADAALVDNRLTTPLHDNAYDRYRAVLLLEPANSAARAGLNSVLLAYAELARAALRDGDPDQAGQLLAQAREYYAGNPLLDDVQKAVGQAQQESRRQWQRLIEQDLVGDEFVLPPAELSRKSADITRFLTKIAERLRDTDESILILARTDAEARWIYKQMKAAVPDYRIRGNIRLTSKPSLQLMPPL